jgi:hypothetical protein
MRDDGVEPTESATINYDEEMMALKIEASCPQGHFLGASLRDMPNSVNLNIAGNIRLEGKCPICGEGPMQARSGYYETDTTGLMRRVGDYRPLNP